MTSFAQRCGIHDAQREQALRQNSPPHRCNRPGTGSLRLVRLARRHARQDARRFGRGAGDAGRCGDGQHPDAQGQLRSHGLQGVRTRGHGATSGLRVRQQSGAPGRPGKLQATAVDARHRLGARPAVVPERPTGGTGHTQRAATRTGAPRRGRAHHEVRPGDRVPHLPHRRHAGPAGSRAGGLAGRAARGQHDPPGLQPADRSLVRHGRGAAAHRPAHGAGPGTALAVTRDRTGSQPGGSGVRGHRCPGRRRQHGVVSQCGEAGLAPGRLPRQFHVPSTLPQHHVQWLALASIAGGCARAQRLSP